MGETRTGIGCVLVVKWPYELDTQTLRIASLTTESWSRMARKLLNIKREN